MNKRDVAPWNTTLVYSVHHKYLFCIISYVMFYLNSVIFLEIRVADSSGICSSIVRSITSISDNSSTYAQFQDFYSRYAVLSEKKADKLLEQTSFLCCPVLFISGAFFCLLIKILSCALCFERTN